VLPHTWIAGDDEMGRSSEFRRELQARGERYLLAVPSNTLVRDLDEPPPEYSGRGRHPRSPFQRLDRRRAAFAEEAWTKIEVRDGEKGPLVIEVLKRRVQARTPTGGTGPEELLFVTRELQSDKTYKYDYYLSNADPETPLEELARVAKAAHRIEECLERAKGEAGLADYQVRNWDAWHRHQTLSLLATWFLTEETRRGKNPDPCADRAAVAQSGRGPHRSPARQQPSRQAPPSRKPLAAPQRASALLLLSFT
jgi:SRSO17 transposase